jgi:hypothetical protein
MGIDSVTWRDIREDVGPGKFYEKVVFRKLGGTRSEEMMALLDEFLEEVWSHQYGLSIGKIAARIGQK